MPGTQYAVGVPTYQKPFRTRTPTQVTTYPLPPRLSLPESDKQPWFILHVNDDSTSSILMHPYMTGDT